MMIGLGEIRIQGAQFGVGAKGPFGGRGRPAALGCR